MSGDITTPFYEKRQPVKTESSQWFPARKRFILIPLLLLWLLLWLVPCQAAGTCLNHTLSFNILKMLRSSIRATMMRAMFLPCLADARS
jgi:hypothetical protein